jgi:magnesium chelatase family protein
VEEASSAVRARVDAARSRQSERGGGLNAALQGRKVVAECRLNPAARKLLARSGEHLRLSARAYFRVLRVARTIADLAGEDVVAAERLAEALHYRIESSS